MLQKFTVGVKRLSPITVGMLAGTKAESLKSG